MMTMLNFTPTHKKIFSNSKEQDFRFKKITRLKEFLTNLSKKENEKSDIEI